MHSAPLCLAAAFLPLLVLAPCCAQSASVAETASACVTDFYAAQAAGNHVECYRLTCAADRPTYAFRLVTHAAEVVEASQRALELRPAAEQLQRALQAHGIDLARIHAARKRGARPQEFFVSVRDPGALLEDLGPGERAFALVLRRHQARPEPTPRVVSMTLLGPGQARVGVAWSNNPEDAPPDLVGTLLEEGRWRVDFDLRGQVRASNTLEATSLLRSALRALVEIESRAGGRVPSDFSALLREAGRAEAIDPRGHSGYRFTYRAEGSAWCLLATPLTPGETGEHYLAIDHTLGSVRSSPTPFQLDPSGTRIVGGTPLGQ